MATMFLAAFFGLILEMHDFVSVYAFLTGKEAAGTTVN